MIRRIAVFMALACLLAFASLAAAETCEYDTRWGVLTITYDWNANSIYGHYPHKNGTINGNWTGQHTLEGVWNQNDGGGYFQFNMHQTGFTGKWMYSNDAGWRGQWNGQLRGCY